MLEKPSEAVMCRPTPHGGLGVQSVKFKSQATLIRSFMETAANPKFRQSLLHSHLFRYHVLEDTSLPDPGFLPYYPLSFFQTIKQVHDKSALNVRTMTTSQWVQVLTEDGLTMEVKEDQTRHYIPCKAELAAPSNNWELSWTLSRLKGLSSEMTSFNFKLLHCILPVKDRVHHLTPSTSPACTLCTESAKENQEHALISCSYNSGTGLTLLATLKKYIPDITPEKLLKFQLAGLSESEELAITFFTSAFLLEIWTRRTKKIKITLYDIRATLEARCLLLRETRFKNNAEIITQMLNYL